MLELIKVNLNSNLLPFCLKYSLLTTPMLFIYLHVLSLQLFLLDLKFFNLIYNGLSESLSNFSIARLWLSDSTLPPKSMKPY